MSCSPSQPGGERRGGIERIAREPPSRQIADDVVAHFAVPLAHALMGGVTDAGRLAGQHREELHVPGRLRVAAREPRDGERVLRALRLDPLPVAPFQPVDDGGEDLVLAA